MSFTPGKLAIIGAGSVGSSLAYAALIRNSARDVVLYDINTARVDAEVLDLAHGTPFIGSASVSGGSDLDKISGAQAVVITAGAKQEPGQTRLELAGVNARILRSLLPELIQRAPDAVFILVTNPCDVLTVIADDLLGLPAGRVFSSGTVLDTARLRWLIADAVGVAASSVHATIIGEHGDSEFPLFSAAMIGQRPLREWVNGQGEIVFTRDRLEQLTSDVVNAAQRIIAGKGATNYAIGLSAARIVEAVFRNERAILPVSSVLHGYQGIDGIALSVPSIVGSGGVERVLDVPMDDYEHSLLEHSVEALRGTLSTVRASS
ncbi:MAG: L-lactate dehydrogenase [Salinibacterium sp.]|nr:L-lactate dehydrogenase [Salinibacterium sp.]